MELAQSIIKSLLTNVKIAASPKAAKFVAALSIFAALAGKAVADGVITGEELVELGIALTGAFAVFWIPNQK